MRTKVTREHGEVERKGDIIKRGEEEEEIKAEKKDKLKWENSTYFTIMFINWIFDPYLWTHIYLDFESLFWSFLIKNKIKKKYYLNTHHLKFYLKKEFRKNHLNSMRY